jgi:hypothetical protein
MTHRQLVRNAWVLGVSGVVCCAVGAPQPAAAAAGAPVHIEAVTSFEEGAVNTFTSTIDGCESGSVTEGRVRIGGGRGPFGIFSGEKIFACDSGETFTLHLNARFPVGPGSVGNWSLLSASDDLGLSSASGKLVGFGTDTGVLDVYDGTLR